MKKMIICFFAVMLFLSNPALAHVSFPKEGSAANEKGSVAAVWKFIISISDYNVDIFYRIENSDLVFEFINLNYDKKVKIWYQFRYESRIGWETQSFIFFSSVTVEKNRIIYERRNIAGAPESARMTLFKILSVEFLKED